MPTLPAIDLGPPLIAAAPHASPAVWVPALTAAFAMYGVNTRLRVAAALGQFAVEAGSGFAEISENLNYTTPERLCAVYPSHFASADAAAPYCEAPEVLANLVYGGRLGNTAFDDGWRFRGAGLINLTGRENLAAFGDSLDMSAEHAADWCRSPAGAAMSGAWFLATHGCLRLADGWQITAISRVVNGPALENLRSRIAASNAARLAIPI